jgi:L-alanine-DL-glutamate epimerase-like enolase superfamily enzyme
MKRREFLATALFAQIATATEEVRITRVVRADIPTKRPKLVGKNSRLGVHGDRSRDSVVRLFTNTGVEGFGDCRMNKQAAKQLLGKRPLEFFQFSANRFVGPFGVGTMPLWDLLGKLAERPVHALLGGAGPERVGVYDGSIYFADLLPQYAGKWRDRFREEIDMGLKAGHRGFKVKVGRGSKWMERAAGDQRDIEVLRVIRKHAGPGVLIGIDANNGYDLAGAKRLLGEVGGLDIAFAEEMFPETVEHCLAFQAFLRARKLKTLLADGESHRGPETFKPFVKARAIDVLQGDMRRFGFEGILAEARMAAHEGLRVAPHNWGSLIGYYMQLQIGRAITNFYRAEHDPVATPVIVADGYTRKEGIATVPDTPGCGLAIDEQAFAKEAKVIYDLKG